MTGAKLAELASYPDVVSSFTYTLKPGWNMISNPFGGNVKLTDVQLKTVILGTPVTWAWQTAADQNMVINAIYYFKGSDWGNAYGFESAGGMPDAVLTPWMAYWIYLDKTDYTYTLVIPKP